MTTIYDQIQDEQKAWQEHNFPGRAPWMPLLGLVEETCDELLDAVARGNKEDIKDAVADTLIFMADFCTGSGFRLQDVFRLAVMLSQESAYLAPLPMCIGKLAHSYLKKAQGIRGTPEKHNLDMMNALIGIVRHCLTEARAEEFPLAETVLSVWKEVQKRDFQVYPLTGRPS